VTRDEALTIYNTGQEVVVKTLCDFSKTIQLLTAQIGDLEMKIAKLSKNSSNSSKPPSSDDITKGKKGKKGKKRNKGGQPGHPRHERPLFPEEAIDIFNSYELDDCPYCNGEVVPLDLPPRVTQQIELKEKIHSAELLKNPRKRLLQSLLKMLQVAEIRKARNRKEKLKIWLTGF